MQSQALLLELLTVSPGLLVLLSCCDVNSRRDISALPNTSKLRQRSFEDSISRSGVDVMHVRAILIMCEGRLVEGGCMRQAEHCGRVADSVLVSFSCGFPDPVAWALLSRNLFTHLD